MPLPICLIDESPFAIVLVSVSRKYSLFETFHLGDVTFIPIFPAYVVPLLISVSFAALFKNAVINSNG